MRPIVVTTDPVLLSFAKTILADAQIEAVELDLHTSAIEGSLGVLPRRLVVSSAAWTAARDALVAAGIGDEIFDDDAGHTATSSGTP
jgi:Putative prokaryotic signal transducing protein